MRFQQSLLLAAAIATVTTAYEAVYLDDKGNPYYTSTMSGTLSNYPDPENANYRTMLASMYSMASEQAAAATGDLDPAKAVFSFAPRETGESESDS
ncbi:hypothetical protein LTR70_005512 [Exophiala xenobiotica]|uniref:Uncharacterized protein n=1 Tax=Lithohypha guttulata TaxID=1690604 RepID=A0ABR0JVZ2_9EURO|nr:hypothetical protein LTR24_009802 [Lithohypha guttulata]KAK5318369.1 hypothetical protein LTR70_005512 [Exophiala xenobiotica]